MSDIIREYEKELAGKWRELYYKDYSRSEITKHIKKDPLFRIYVEVMSRQIVIRSTPGGHSSAGRSYSRSLLEWTSLVGGCDRPATGPSGYWRC